MRNERNVGKVTTQVRLRPYYYEHLKELAIKRSGECGTLVTMSHLIEEMIEERMQAENRDQRSAELFGSRD